MWALVIIHGQRIMLEGDTLSILFTFMSTTDGECYPLLRDVQLLVSLFAHILVQNTWIEGNICADLIASESSFLVSKIMW